MKYVIFYWSRFGHNKKIATTLSEKLSKKGKDTKVFNVDEADPTNVPKADMYVFSAAAEAFRVQKHMRKFMKKLEGLEGKKFAIINTHGMKSKNWLKGMEKLLVKKDMVKVADTDFQIGKEGQEQGQGFIGDWKEKLEDFADEL